MTDKERLQMLIDNDQDYKQLIAEVNAFSGGSKFPTDSVALNYIWQRVPKFAKMNAEEFFATFKCMTAWATVMGRVLDKIHGRGKYDTSKAFDLGAVSVKASNKQALIYYENNPSFFIKTDSLDGELYVAVPLRVFGGKGGLQNGEIEFKLVGPSVIYDPIKNKYEPKLLSSVMEIVIKNNGKEFALPTQVRNFDKTVLMIAIHNSKMGD